MTRGAAVLALTLALACAARAGAQDSAQFHMRQGVEAARAGRWEAARVAFERAYVLDPNPTVLLNLAGAETRTQRLVAAVEHYRMFLELAGPDLADAKRAARQALSEIEPRLVHVRVRVTGGRQEGDQLFVNGRPHSGRLDDVPVDPGRYELRLDRDGSTVARAAGSAVEGEAVEVRLSPVAADFDPNPDPNTNPDPDPNPNPDPDPDPEGSGSFWSSPWPWVGLGAAIVVVIVIIAASSSSDVGGGNAGQPTSGTIDESVGGPPMGRLAVPLRW